MADPVHYIVGLTGGIGSGKSTVANLFADHGIEIVDTDQIAHGLTQPNGMAIAAIRAAFGDDFIAADGALDRNRMREHAFADDSERKKLESILHPMITDVARRLVHEARSAYVIVVVPLLFESGRWKQNSDRTLVVDCSEEEQIRRVRLRSGLSEAQVRAIMDKQLSRADRCRLADDIIDNSADAHDLPAKVEQLHRKYLDLAARTSSICI
jgi:dephospho-CoA kinase